ncbi:ParB N-terminal domain-containing protein [Sphingobium yanoikuyae]|uniref:ParB N-terminal domain-containing protein n=1 Tax=Sphingobium yanoikuyae TaxID=13690 RepID=A0A6P1GI42_SPHYA|nr:DUF6551 family protein [Sphingobium yanoikuyae]QHD68196.1 ParB N-terminal domain-containing protein [Sphingobium yanoikuyae]
MTYLRHAEKSKGTVAGPTDLQIKVQADLPSEKRVLEILADLSDARRIQINRQGRGRSIVTFADRFDDSDEISARIQARNSASSPQKTAVCDTVARSKELGGITRAAQTAKANIKPQKSAASTRAVAALKKWPAATGNPPSVENRHPSELRLDDSYQRSTDNGASQALIRKIANGWDWRMCLPLVVSKRDDGSLWVIDGQHRLAAALLRGDIPFLPCVVGIYGSVADEAAMFVAMNRARKPMNRLDDFHAAIASGDSEAIEITRLITEAGFTVSRKTGSQSWVPGEVAFTSAIAKVLRKHGAKVCADALRTMQEAWPDEVLNAGASMFTALTKLAISPPDGFDPDRMFRALLRRNQREWASFLNETKSGGDERAAQLRQVLLMAYEEEPEVADAE